MTEMRATLIFALFLLCECSGMARAREELSRSESPASIEAGGHLPGKGLAQHDFLYCGEWDTRKTNQILFLIKGGKVVWTYEIPIKDANGNLSEFSDMHRLSNGDIV